MSSQALHIDHFISLCTPVSLRCLLLNVCNIVEGDGLINFLSDTKRGGRLEVLELNGNSLGKKLTNRIRKMVIDGRNKSLLRLELTANDRSEEDLEDEDEDEEVDEFQLQHIFRDALERNRSRRTATQKAGLALLCISRIILLGREASNPSLSLKAVYAHLDRISIAHDKNERLQPLNHFPFKRLPNELQLSILRCTYQLSPESSLDLLPHLKNRLLRESISVSVLTETQFLKVVRYAEDRAVMRIAWERNADSIEDQLNAKERCLESMDCARWGS